MSALYTFNGRKYFKRGGKYIPKFQAGDYVFPKADNYNPIGDSDSSSYFSTADNSSNKIDLPDLGKYSTYDTKTGKRSNYRVPKLQIENDTFNTVGNLGSNFLSGLNKGHTKPSMGRFADKAMDKYSDSGLAEGASTAIGIAGQFDPTMKIVDTALKVGKGIGDVVANRDQYGISKSEAGEVISSTLDPLGKLQQSWNIGKKHGWKEGLKDYVTFGLSGRKLMKDTLSLAKRRADEEDANMRQGITAGNYKNNSLFARDGLSVRPRLQGTGEPNVEVEDGEIVLGAPAQMTLHGASNSSLNSRFATKVHGDKHGHDSDNDGMEGIPMTVPPGSYVASNYLGVDGKKAKNGKTVAKEIEPYVRSLSLAEENKTDSYHNNPQVIAHNQREISRIVKEAEQNKQKHEMLKQIKSINKQSKQSDMYHNYGRFQMGGMPHPGLQQGQPQDPSSMRMDELAAMQNQPMQGQQGGGLSPESQQILAQLPPEVQAEIAKLPPEQQEAAIQAVAAQLGGQGDPAAMGDPNAMPPQPGMEQMPGAQPPMDPSMMAEQQAMAMMAGGQQPMMRSGGAIKAGCKVKFQMGGRVYQGTVKSIDRNGNFELY